MATDRNHLYLVGMKLSSTDFGLVIYATCVLVCYQVQTNLSALLVNVHSSTYVLPSDSSEVLVLVH